MNEVEKQQITEIIDRLISSSNRNDLATASILLAVMGADSSNCQMSLAHHVKEWTEEHLRRLEHSRAMANIIGLSDCASN